MDKWVNLRRSQTFAFVTPNFLRNTLSIIRGYLSFLIIINWRTMLMITDKFIVHLVVVRAELPIFSIRSLGINSWSVWNITRVYFGSPSSRFLQILSDSLVLFRLKFVLFWVTILILLAPFFKVRSVVAFDVFFSVSDLFVILESKDLLLKILIFFFLARSKYMFSRRFSLNVVYVWCDKLIVRQNSFTGTKGFKLLVLLWVSLNGSWFARTEPLSLLFLLEQIFVASRAKMSNNQRLIRLWRYLLLLRRNRGDSCLFFRR